MLKRFDIKSYLHIVLDSQPSDGSHVRSEDGSVKRKPLKHRRRVGGENSRLIPIMDKRTAEILVKRFNQQAEFCKGDKYGPNKADYLLFEGIDKNRISNKLRKAYQGTQY